MKFVKAHSRFIRLFSVSLLTAAMIMSMAVVLSANAFAAQVGGRTVTSRAAVVIDYETGVVIFSYNADEVRVPASMIKVLATAVVLEAIEDGRISFDTLVRTTPSISAFSLDRRFSNVPMPVGSLYTVRQLIDAVMLRSGGAATVALGELLYGTEAAFIARMSEKAAEFGVVMEVDDSWGLSANNRISAYYMAQLSRAIISEYPIILEISAQETMTFDNVTMNSTTQLLGEYYGLDGLKTGFTRAAGWCFAGTAIRDGRRLISITMGSSDLRERFNDTVILLDYGFANFYRGLARHFRAEIEPLNNARPFGNALVPISLYSDAEHRELFSFSEMAVILNEG